jgi:hypothetical protein
MLCRVDWLFVTDVSGQLIGTFFRRQAVQEGFLTLEDGSDMLSRKVSNYHLLYATSQKSEDLIYTVAEAWNHAQGVY